MFGYSFNSHTYSFAVSGLKYRSKNFNSRECANELRYELESKYGLQLKEVYDDKHDKTYVYTNGVKIYIHRN